MMRTALTRLAKGSLIYGIGGMLQRFMSLLLLPFYTRVLTPEDYGVVALISLVGVAMNGLLSLGTGNSMGLLYYREDNLSKRPSIIWTTVLMIAVNCSFWYIVFLLSAPSLSWLMFQNDRYADLIRLAFLGTVLSNIADPWLAYLRMEENEKQYIAIAMSSSLLSIIISVWLVLCLHMGIFGLIFANTVAQSVMLGVIWCVVGRTLPFGLNCRLFIPLVRIGLPSIFGLFAFLLIDYADRQMIERMLGLSDLGVYSVAYSFGMVMTIAVGSFATAWPPFFMSYINKHEDACHVFGRVLTYYVIGFGSLIVVFFFVAKPAVLLLTAPAFHEAWCVVGLIAGSYALKGVYLIFLPGIYFANKLHCQSVIEWIAALTNIGLNLWLIPIYGIVGAAMATFVSYLSLPAMAWYMARRYLAVEYQWGRLGFSFAAAGLASVMLNQISFWFKGVLLLELLANGSILITFFAISYGFLLTANERGMIKARINA